MHAALVIAGKDLRQRLRDRSAIVLGFVAPVVIAGLMSLAFSGTENFHVTVGLVDRDHGAVASAMTGLLRSHDLQDLLTVKHERSVEAARSLLRKRKLGAAIVIPAGFSTAATGTKATHVDVLTSVDEQISGQVVKSVVGGFTAQVDADRLSVATAIAAGAPIDEASTLAARAAKLRVPETAVLTPTGAEPLKAISYYAPGMAIFFVFFAVSFGARSFHAERREGTLDRVVAAPITPTAVLAGKALSVFVYGVLSLATMAVVTSLVFGADWGPAPAAALLCLALVVAVVCVTAFVIVVARTERQSEGFASIVVFGFALLGGNFIFVSSSPPLMRKLALATPNGWALRGFTDLATGAGSGAVVQPVVAICAFSVVVGAIAAVNARRAVLR